MTGAEIRAFREQEQLAQKEFAAAIGVSNATMCNWENERYAPPPEWDELLEKLMKGEVKLPKKEPAKPAEPVKTEKLAKPVTTKTTNPCKTCPYWQHMDGAKSKTMYCACLQETGHVRTCGVERTYQRRRTLSLLSLDAARAAELGLSYGQYKAREVV